MMWQTTKTGVEVKQAPHAIRLGLISTILQLAGRDLTQTARRRKEDHGERSLTVV